MTDCIQLCLLQSQWASLIYITLGSTQSSKKHLVETSAYKLHHFSGEKSSKSPLHACLSVSE